MSYAIEIKRKVHHDLRIFSGLKPDEGRLLHTTKWDPDQAVILTESGQKVAWRAIIDALAELSGANLDARFSARDQLDIGRELYRRTLGQLNEPPRGEAQIVVHSNDEDVVRLPWSLLADAYGNFLVMGGASVTLACAPDWEAQVTLTPSPPVLVVLPEPKGLAPTDGGNHLRNLERTLEPDPELRAGRNLRVACTWEDYLEAIKDFAPEVIYYYGHGEGNANESRLCFASREGNQERLVHFADFARPLAKLPEKPRVIYLNCCYGDAGGILGAGLRLRAHAHAVVTNRTVAAIPAAQAQGEAVLKGLLIDGRAPHELMPRVTTELTDRVAQLGVGNVRWITPVFWRGYSKWKGFSRSAAGSRMSDPHWHLKIDRIFQFGAVVDQTSQMLSDRRVRTLAFIWHGAPGQGCEIFHHRIDRELPDKLPNAVMETRRPIWSDEFVRPHVSYAQMVLKAVGLPVESDISEAPPKIRGLTGGAANGVLYLDHQSINESGAMNVERLLDYLEWWDDNLGPRLREDNVFVVIGVSFVTNDPGKLNGELAEIDDLDLKHTEAYALTPLKQVERGDLVRFFRTHDNKLTKRQRDKLIKKILDETQGHYEQTVYRLRVELDLPPQAEAGASNGETSEDE